MSVKKPLQRNTNGLPMRIGIGFDSHKFGKGHLIRLGGVDIPSSKKLIGHSDADVLLHALTDALLGAVGAPDIGEQFPPTNARYKGADSKEFIRSALKQIDDAGWRVGNVDATVIADSPKLGSHKARMCRVIARLLDVSVSCVSVKAKTSEGTSIKGKGIAAQVATLLVPNKRPTKSHRVKKR